MAPVTDILAAVPRLKLGEGPHWEASEGALYLADLSTGDLLRWCSKTNNTIRHNVGAHASFIIPIKGRPREFVVGSKLDLLHVGWDVETNKITKREVLATLTEEPPTTKINDAKCDVNGRLWFGTWDDRLIGPMGSFFSYTPKEGLVKHEAGIHISNGIGFSSDNRTMYYGDTLKFRVDQYKVDPNTGTREFEKTAFDFREAKIDGGPDGLTVDADGKLWIACVFGSRIVQVDPDSGKVLRSLQFPRCTQITSVTFGGPSWTELFATSADLVNFPNFEHTTGAPDAGTTYRISALGTKGLPPNEFNFDL